MHGDAPGSLLRRSLETAVLLVTLVLAVETFVVAGVLRPIAVAGDSMLPALADGDRLWVRRWPEPSRWRVAVLRDPTDQRRLVVKRVVGLPGESVAFRGGAVWVDGRRQDPPPAQRVYYGAMGSPTWRLGPDDWLVVGDNQIASIDSRNWDHAPGAPSRLLVGEVIGER